MYDLFIVCKEPYTHSLFACVGTAVVSTKQEGAKVALMITQQAIAALAENKFTPAPLLIPYAGKLSAASGQFGFPEDPVQLIKMAVSEGVRVFTCELWAGIVSRNSLPPELEIITVSTLISIISESKKILGSF